MPRPAHPLIVSLLVFSHAGADDGATFFENKIRPIFAEHCYQCHSAEAKKVKGALKLDTKEDLLKGAHASAARLFLFPLAPPLTSVHCMPRVLVCMLFL